MKLSLNTSIFDILSVNTYNSPLEPDYSNVEYDIEQVQEAGKLTEEILDNASKELYQALDMGSYKSELGRAAIEHITEHQLDDLKALPFGVTDIALIGIDSPREYNFRGDDLDFTLEVADNISERLLKWLNDNGNEEFYADMESRYGTRDGFNSHMPTTSDEMEQACITDIERAFSMIALYILEDEGFDSEENEREFVMTWMENTYIGNHFNDNERPNLDKVMDVAGDL